MKRLLAVCAVLAVVCLPARADLFPLGATYSGTFSTYNSSGVLTDADSTPTCSGYIGSSNTAVSSATVTQMGSTGRYRYTLVMSSGNGYAAGSSYSIRCTATVSSLTQDDDSVDGIYLLDTPATAGILSANVKQYGGTNGTFASGRPEVNTTHIAGSSVSTSSAQIGVNLVSTSANAITATSLNADTITAAKVAADLTEELQEGQFIRRGTAQAGASTTITLDSGASASNDYYKNDIIDIISGTGAAQARIIASYVGATKVATVDSAWVTNPDNTSVFRILPFSSVPGASAPTVVQIRQEMDTNSTQLAKLGAPAGASISADIASVQADTDNIQTRIPAALVSGRIDSSVGAVQNNAITAAGINADAITAAKLASDVATEIQTGLYTIRRNVAGQRLPIWFFDTTTSAPKTGLSTSAITCVVDKDFTGFVTTNDTTESEVGNGLYFIDLLQTETDAAVLNFACSAAGARTYTATITPQR